MHRSYYHKQLCKRFVSVFDKMSEVHVSIHLFSNRSQGKNVSDALVGAPSILLFGPYHIFTLPVWMQSNIEFFHEAFTNNLNYKMLMMFWVNTTTCACIFSPVIRSSC